MAEVGDMGFPADVASAADADFPAGDIATVADAVLVVDVATAAADTEVTAMADGVMAGDADLVGTAVTDTATAVDGEALLMATATLPIGAAITATRPIHTILTTTTPIRRITFPIRDRESRWASWEEVLEITVADFLAADFSVAVGADSDGKFDRAS